MAVWYYFFYFFCYAVLGWILEVLYQLVKTGKFINRGMLNGPYCPIYAFGAIGMLIFLHDYTDSFLYIFAGAIFFGSLAELIGGFIIDKIFKIRFWDYSDIPFNIGGYICLKFSLAWGFIGLFFINYIHPLVAKLSMLLPNLVMQALVIIGILIIISDIIITISELLGLTKIVQSLSKQKVILRSISEGFGQNITETAIKLEDNIQVKKHNLKDKAFIQKEQYLKIAKAYKERLSQVKQKLSQGVKRRFKVFPKLKSKNKHYNEVLKEIKDSLKL